jgi:hypothetical protein
MQWLLILLVLVSSAHGDVTRKHKTSSVSFGAFDATSTEYYAEDRSANETSTLWTKGMMKTMTGGKERASTTITRLDKEVVWTLDPKEKTYNEMTFAEFREMMKKSMKEMQDAKGEDEAKADTVSEDMYEWKTEAKSDPNPKTIHGWTCRNMHVVAVGTNKQNPEDRVSITVNNWNSPDVPGAEEIRAFQERYVKAIGLDEMALTPGMMNAAMMFEKQLKSLIEESKKAPGEPVTSLIEIKRHELVGPSVGEAMKEGMKSELMGKLPFGKKKEEPKAQEPKYEERVKFSVNTELMEASTGNVDAAKFEIPAKFKLKKK